MQDPLQALRGDDPVLQSNKRQLEKYMLSSSKVNSKIAKELSRSKVRLPFPGLGEEEKGEQYVHSSTIVPGGPYDRKREVAARHRSLEDPGRQAAAGGGIATQRNSVLKQRPLGSEYDYAEAKAVPLPVPSSVRSVRSVLTKENLNMLPGVENQRYNDKGELTSKHSGSNISKLGLRLMQSNLANHLNNKSQKKMVRIRDAPDQISEASFEEDQPNGSQLKKHYQRRKTENPEEMQNYLTKIRCFSCGNDMNSEEVRMSLRMNAMFVEDVIHNNERTLTSPEEKLDQEHYCYKCFYE